MKITNTKYNVIIQQNKNNVFSYALYMLKNRMDAEDVTQEVLIKVWENMGKFKLSSARSWIIKTTHNKCIDLLRKRSMHSSRICSIDENIETSVVDNQSENNPFAHTHNNLTAAKAKEAIKSLPDNLRSVFVLYEIENLKYREISKALDLPINTVKVNLFRARKQLQKELKKYELQEAI